MLEKVSLIHKTYLLDQQLLCWRHFSKTEVVQKTDLNILTVYLRSTSFVINQFLLTLRLQVRSYDFLIMVFMFFEARQGKLRPILR